MSRVPLEDLHSDPDNHPPQDETLINLLMALSEGKIPLFWAAIPLRYVRPFSPTYKPLSWTPWRELLDEYRKRIEEKVFPPLLTYQVGDFFVVSDDYAQYYAYMESNSDYASCYVLGAPRGENIVGVRAATDEESRRMLGLG